MLSGRCGCEQIVVQTAIELDYVGLRFGLQTDQSHGCSSRLEAIEEEGRAGGASAILFGGRKFFRSLKTTDETVANAKLWRANETLRRLEQGDLAIPDGMTFDEAFDFIVSGGKQIAEPELVADVTLEQIKKDYFARTAQRSQGGFVGRYREDPCGPLHPNSGWQRSHPILGRIPASTLCQ